ncbi:hypothetical protein CR513_01097, partial [Mucuna pruriens]
MFPTRTFSARMPESDEELLKMFLKVEINIPFLDAIKQIPKYAKFLKELCVHKRKKMKKGVESRGVQQALPKKCRDPRIFSVPCTIDDCTFVDAMSDLGALIKVMPTSIYKALKFGDLEAFGMTIQLENRSVVQPFGILEDVLVQVNELIFQTDFYVLDMEDKTSENGSTLILGRPFLMTARTKTDVHAETLSMEFGDHLVQFNLFEAMKHPTEDHSLFGIDLIDKLVEEHFQLNIDNGDTLDFAEDINIFDCLGSKVRDLSNFEDGITNLADLGPKEELLDLLDQVCKLEDSEYSNNVGVQVVGIKKQLSAQVATMFVAEYMPTTGSQEGKKAEVDSIKNTSIEPNLIIHAKDESTSDNEDWNLVPSKSGSNTKHNAESDSNPTRIGYTSANMSQ